MGLTMVASRSVDECAKCSEGPLDATNALRHMHFELGHLLFELLGDLDLAVGEIGHAPHDFVNIVEEELATHVFVFFFVFRRFFLTPRLS